MLRRMSMSAPHRSVRRVAETTIHPGMNREHRVRLVLEPDHWDEFDPFLMLAEDWFVAGTFGDHPHRGFETVTFVLDGQIEHRDNRGGAGVLEVGDAQWMTAGSGVVHSEEAGPQGAHSLQLWLNLPRTLKMTEPRYQDLRGSAMPVRREEGVVARVFSGRSGNLIGPALNHTPVTMVEFRIEAGSQLLQDLPASYNAFLYILSGSGRFGAEERAAHESQVVWFRREEGDIVMQADEPVHAMLWAGEPIGEPVAARGPFVMNRMDEVIQAYSDFRSGRF